MKGLNFTLTSSRTLLTSQANQPAEKKDIPVPSYRPYSPLSFIARTEVDANDAVEPAEGSGVAPGLGRAGQSLAEVVTFRDRGYVRAEPQIPRPEAATSLLPIHIRGVCASGLRPPHPKPEAHGRWAIELVPMSAARPTGPYIAKIPS